MSDAMTFDHGARRGGAAGPALVAGGTPSGGTRMTAAELLELPRGLGVRYELIDGELRTMAPAGWNHGDIASELDSQLRVFVKSRTLGRVFAAETGFRLATALVRAPDAAFVRTARIPADRGPGFFPGAPDLAVEVVSPRDRSGAVAEKVACWLDHGTHEVWVADPETRTIAVYRRGERPVRVLGPDDTLESVELLPGFAVRVAEFFPETPSSPAPESAADGASGTPEPSA